MSELQLQAACYQWAFNTHLALRGCIFSVPNGGTRNIAEAQQLKASGLTPGIPDILIVWPELIGCEFKTPTGIISPAQQKIHAIWRERGIRVEIVRTIEEWKKLIGSLRFT